MRAVAIPSCMIAVLVSLALPALAADPSSAASPAGVDDYRPAQLLKAKNPQYPTKALQNRIEGTVIVRFIVDEEGKVKKARISKGIDLLNDAALEAVRAWKFKPAVRAGHTAEVTLEAPVSFQLPQR